MKVLQTPVRLCFDLAERGLDLPFGQAWNPLRHLGALGFFMYWIVAATGIYLYIFFDTGITEAYDSVEYMTHDQWYLAGIMRSLHRYASDAMIVFMVIHIVREFAHDRYRGARWFSWVTGVPAVVLLFVCGITGYWLVWDKLAQFVAIRTTEWLDWLPIFGTPVAANFLSDATLDDRFFSLMIFIHIAAPLILLLILWIHLARVSRPKIHPPRGLAIGMFAAFVALSLVKPALSHAPADLGTVVAVVQLDWFYLGLYPLYDQFSAGALWAAVAILGFTIVLVPWMPPMRRVPAAEVFLEHCNGCMRCADDCPYSAVTMEPRTDGMKFDREAVVNPKLCVSCGICVGSCPSSTPFRRRGEIATGIDLPHLSLSTLRERVSSAGETLSGEGRVMVIGCENTLRYGVSGDASTAFVTLPCAGMLPPSFIDFILSRGLADGVLVAGCAEHGCHNRFGNGWTEARIERRRDPALRARVPREQVSYLWLAGGDRKALAEGISGFSERLKERAKGKSAAGGGASAPRAAEVKGAGDA